MVGVINSSLSPELWEWRVRHIALTPLLILYCHRQLFGQAEDCNHSMVHGSKPWISWVTKTDSLSGKQNDPGRWYLLIGGWTHSASATSILPLTDFITRQSMSKDALARVSSQFLQCHYLVLSQWGIRQEDSMSRNSKAEPRQVPCFSALQLLTLLICCNWMVSFCKASILLLVVFKYPNASA